MDPNSFPIQRLSADLIEDYESIWDVEKDTLKKQMLRKVGHYLNLKDSTIDHHGSHFILNYCRGWKRCVFILLTTLASGLTWHFAWSIPWCDM